jgi:hypothetical protein
MMEEKGARKSIWAEVECAEREDHRGLEVDELM